MGSSPGEGLLATLQHGGWDHDGSTHEMEKEVIGETGSKENSRVRLARVVAIPFGHSARAVFMPSRMGPQD